VPHPSKAKGNRLEREVVNKLKENNIAAKRSWGSDGRSMGMDEEVDVLIEHKNHKLACQVKARKKLGQVVRPNTDVIDCQVIKEDRGKIFFVITLDTFVNLIKGE
jgi:Holliday junction resolvase